ncbi:hypothetical protein FNQ90_24905, partial [Streptomyces alkaliphilus]|nr:hypothetical protein [Streptomyces alkaliphilus]
MTKTATEVPQAPPETAPAPETPTTTPDTTTPSASAKPGVRHTPGGLPAVPVAVNAANTLVGGLSAAVLAVGPGMVAASAAGALATAGGAALARRTRRGRADKARVDRLGGGRGSAGHRAPGATLNPLRSGSRDLGASGGGRAGAGRA